MPQHDTAHSAFESAKDRENQTGQSPRSLPSTFTSASYSSATLWPSSKLSIVPSGYGNNPNVWRPHTGAESLSRRSTGRIGSVHVPLVISGKRLATSVATTPCVAVRSSAQRHVLTSCIGHVIDGPPVRFVLPCPKSVPSDAVTTLQWPSLMRIGPGLSCGWKR
jgi:hypothetical protein